MNSAHAVLIKYAHGCSHQQVRGGKALPSCRPLWRARMTEMYQGYFMATLLHSTFLCTSKVAGAKLCAQLQALMACAHDLDELGLFHGPVWAADHVACV